MATINIEGKSKAAVLAALYNHSKVQGMGYLQARPGEMTESEAQTLLDQHAQYGSYFDYLYGRILKVDLSKETFEGYLYDRDLGEGAAQRAVDSVA